MNLTEKILHALKPSQYWTEKTRESGNTIQGLICPECGDKNAWCYRESPLAICCNRLSTCGARVKTLDLLGIKKDIEREFKPTKADPHRPAREYLRSRGITKAAEGLEFIHKPNLRNTGSGGVLFSIYTDDKVKRIYNGRLYNPPPGEGKTHNTGSTAGRHWRHPGREYRPGEKTYVVEGIIDCLSLWEMGLPSIAVLSAGQDPAKVDLADLKSNLVLAFDNDTAGARATRKWLTVYPEETAILPDPGQDWNDLLCSGDPATAAKRFHDNLPRYRVNAQLALAGTAREYVDIYREFYGTVPGLFEYGGETWFSTIRKRGDDTQVSVELAGRFTIQVQSYLIDRSNPALPEYRYHLKITPAKGRPVTATAAGRDLASSLRAREFFLSHARQAWPGGNQATSALCDRITSARNTPEVKQLTLTGYDAETGWYVFDSYAIDQGGMIHHPDTAGLYKISGRDWCKAASHAADKFIKPAATGPDVKKIHELLLAAWGDNAAFALAWTVASWHVNQIKEKLNWFPFLSLHGDVQAGKTALLTLLNACQCHQGEGLPISQLNTKKALARSIARESGRSVALLEDNGRNDKAFDYSILLTAYNKGPLQLQASFSNDLRTHEAPFQGALLFCQNFEPFTGEAERERVISLHFKADDLTDRTRAAHDELFNLPLPQLARVMPATLQQRKVIESEWFKEYEQAVKHLSVVDNRRIMQNHAVPLAFHRLFCRIHGIKHDLTTFTLELAAKKCETAAAQDYTLATHFFESLDELDRNDSNLAKNLLPIAYHVDESAKRLYINMPTVEHLFRQKGLAFTVNDALTKALCRHPAYLKNSFHYRFPGDPEMNAAGRPKQRRCWVFDITKMD
jgi:hypothetical protein